MMGACFKHKNFHLMTRKTIVAGNWKMHKTIKEAAAFMMALVPMAASSKCEVFIAPPFTALSACAEAARGSHVQIGGQNMSDADEGAFTGEISAKMLKDAGASFVLLGHSERRSHFQETDEHINHKLKKAVREGILPILCIGENETQREAGHTEQVLNHQIDIALQDLSEEQLSKLVVAYEPVWAIGTGKTATPELAEATHKQIRTHLASHFSDSFADNLSILYGGSVKPANIDQILNQPNVDGALIGGASLDIEAFSQMVQR